MTLSNYLNHFLNIFLIAGKTDAERKIEELTRALEVNFNFLKYKPRSGHFKFLPLSASENSGKNWKCPRLGISFKIGSYEFTISGGNGEK